MSRIIPPVDLMFFLTESASSPKHVGAVLTFKLPQGAKPGFVRRIVEAYRAAEAVAPFNYVADLPLAGTPRWRTAASLDMNYHVQHVALPEGAPADELRSLIQDLHEPMLDRDRPLFRVHFIENPADGSLVIYLKAHHAIVDGASAMARILASMNEDAAARRVEPFYAVDMKVAKTRVPKGVLDRLNALQRSARKQTVALAGVSLGMLRKSLGGLLRSPAKGSLPFTAPHTLMNEPTRAARSFAMLTLPLSEMRAVGKACGGTLNDVAATIVAEGIHRYLAQVGAPVRRPLVAMCPLSLREADDKEATTKASVMFVPLGMPTIPVRERMDQVIAGIGSAKEELRAMSKEAALIYALSAFTLGEVADLLPTRSSVTGPIANFVLSNVPGGRSPLFLSGVALTGMYPISALGIGIGLNVTLASYVDSMDFGFVGNGVAMKRLPDLARHTREAFEELKVALAPPARAAKTKRRPAKKAPALPRSGKGAGGGRRRSAG